MRSPESLKHTATLACVAAILSEKNDSGSSSSPQSPSSRDVTGMSSSPPSSSRDVTGTSSSPPSASSRVRLTNYVVALLQTGCFTAVSERILRRLVEYAPAQITNTLLQLLLPPHVREITLTDCGSVTLMGLVDALVKCCHVYKLDLTHCDQLVHLHMFQFMGLHDIPITTLILEGTDSLTDNCVQTVIQLLPHLVTLNLSSCSQITGNAFLVDAHTQLKRELSPHMLNDTERTYNYPLSCVDVSGCRNITNMAVQHLVSLCGRHLRHLNLAWTNVECSVLLHLAGYHYPTVILTLLTEHGTKFTKQFREALIDELEQYKMLYTEFMDTLDVTGEVKDNATRGIASTNKVKSDNEDNIQSNPETIDKLLDALKGGVSDLIAQEGQFDEALEQLDGMDCPIKLHDVEVRTPQGEEKVYLDAAADASDNTDGQTSSAGASNDITDSDHITAISADNDDKTSSDHKTTISTDEKGVISTVDKDKTINETGKSEKLKTVDDLIDSMLSADIHDDSEVPYDLNDADAIDKDIEDRSQLLPKTCVDKGMTNTDNKDTTNSVGKECAVAHTSDRASEHISNRSGDTDDVIDLHSSDPSGEDSDRSSNTHPCDVKLTCDNSASSSVDKTDINGATNSTEDMTERVVQATSRGDGTGSIDDTDNMTEGVVDAPSDGGGNRSDDESDDKNEKIKPGSCDDGTITDDPRCTVLGRYDGLVFEPSLISLDLININFRTHEGVDTRSTKFGELVIQKFFAVNKSLQHFAIMWKGFSADLLKSVLPSLTALEDVALEECTFLQSGGVAALARDCTKLRKVNLRGVVFFKDMAMTPYLSLENLTTLSLAESQITDVTLTRLSNRLAHSLTDLDLSWCGEDITERGVNAICLKCTKLKSLKMRMCPVSDVSLQLLSESCRDLTTLVIESVEEVSNNNNVLSDAGVVTLAENLTELRVLDISWNLSITNTSLHAILSHCTHLKEACFKGLKRITCAPFLPIIAGNATQTVHRSTVYAPNLRVLDLEYSDLVEDVKLKRIVNVCQGLLQVTDYYGQRMEPDDSDN